MFKWIGYGIKAGIAVGTATITYEWIHAFHKVFIDKATVKLTDLAAHLKEYNVDDEETDDRDDRLDDDLK